MATGDKSPFTEIDLSEIQPKKKPKRLLYFSDGVLEEYSTDEDECDAKTKDTTELINPATLTWLPYFNYWFWKFGYGTLSVCDYLGERFAWFFGITTPKFQYEIDQYNKMMKEEEELAKHIQSENSGWTDDTSASATVATQPVLKRSSQDSQTEVLIANPGNSSHDGEVAIKF